MIKTLSPLYSFAHDQEIEVKDECLCPALSDNDEPSESTTCIIEPDYRW